MRIGRINNGHIQFAVSRQQAGGDRYTCRAAANNDHFMVDNAGIVCLRANDALA